MPCNQQPEILTVYQTHDSKHTIWWLRNTRLLLRRFYLTNMFLKLLMLIAIFHVANVITRWLLLLPVSKETAIRTTNPSFLLYSQTGSAITTSTHAQNLLLLSVQDNPAITMATHAKYSLQLLSALQWSQLRNYGSKSLALLRQRRSSNYDGTSHQLLTSVDFSIFLWNLLPLLWRLQNILWGKIPGKGWWLRHQ